MITSLCGVQAVGNEVDPADPMPWTRKIQVVLSEQLLYKLPYMPGDLDIHLSAGTIMCIIEEAMRRSSKVLGLETVRLSDQRLSCSHVHMPRHILDQPVWQFFFDMK